MVAVTIIVVVIIIVIDEPNVRLFRDQNHLQGGMCDLKSGRSVQLTPNDVYTQVPKVPTPDRLPSSYSGSPFYSLQYALDSQSSCRRPSGHLQTFCCLLELHTVGFPKIRTPSCTILPPESVPPPNKGQVSHLFPWGAALPFSLKTQVSGLPWEALDADPTSVPGLAWGLGHSFNGGTSGIWASH